MFGLDDFKPGIDFKPNDIVSFYNIDTSATSPTSRFGGLDRFRDNFDATINLSPTASSSLVVGCSCPTCLKVFKCFLTYLLNNLRILSP